MLSGVHKRGSHRKHEFGNCQHTGLRLNENTEGEETRMCRLLPTPRHQYSAGGWEEQSVRGEGNQEKMGFAKVKNDPSSHVAKSCQWGIRKCPLSSPETTVMLT